MIKDTVVYPGKIPLTLELRGGQDCHCYPQAELSSVYNYQYFEIGFSFSTISYGSFQDYLKLLNENCENLLFYDYSLFDNNLVAPYCTTQELYKIEKIMSSWGW